MPQNKEKKPSLAKAIGTVLAGNFATQAGATGLAGLAYQGNKLTKSSPKEIASLLKGLADKHKINVAVQDSGLSGILGMMMGTNYNHQMRTVNLGSDSGEAVALHELGHAKDYKHLGHTKARLRTLPPLAAFPLFSRRLRKSIAGKNKESLRYKAENEIEKHPWLAGAVPAAPVLYQEGKASAFALRQLHKLHGGKGVLKGLAALAPAFGSYLALPATAGILSHVAIRYQQRKHKDKY